MKKFFVSLLAIYFAFLFGTGVYAQNDFFPQGIAYLQMLRALKDHSFYEPSEKEIMEFHQCVLRNGFAGSENKSCFKKDKFAFYHSPEEAGFLDEESEGKFSGIGVSISPNKEKTGIEIKEIIPGSPAEKEGSLKPGDIINAVGESADKINIIGADSGEAARRIRGAVGTRVFLKIIRNGTVLPLIIITRGEVKKIEADPRQIDGRTGYLKISGFMKRELIKDDILPVLRQFRISGIKNLIVDLRNNPGGLLSDSIRFLDLFAPRPDDLILEIRGRDRSSRKKFLSVNRGSFADLRVVLLVNNESASASEIVAGVLQIWGAKIIGQKTFGKGSVQNLLPLADGGRFRFTIAKYYFSNGKTPDGEGIKPDMEIADDPSTQKDEILEKAIEFLKTQ